MPFQTSQAYYYRQGNCPYQVVIPKDVVVPFLGNITPTISDLGWNRYSNADQYYLASTTTQSEIGKTTREIPNEVYLDFATGNAGEHSGDSTFPTLATYSKEKNQFATLMNNIAGSHTHNVSFGLAQSRLPKISMTTQNVTYIRATKRIKRLPEGVLIFKETSELQLQRHEAPSGAGCYIVGQGTGNVAIIPGNNVQALNTATGTIGAGHVHSGQGGYDYATGGVGYNYGYAGEHSHIVGATHTQTSIGSKTKYPYQGGLILNAWRVLQARLCPIDTVVMYVGNILELPEDWYLCDGKNGTINVGENVIGFAGGSSWMTPQTANSYLQVNILGAGGTGITAPRFPNDPYVGTGAAGHNHNNGESGSGLAGANHSNYSWNHTHTLSGSVQSFHPATYKFAFIQYKGKLYGNGAKYGAGT